MFLKETLSLRYLLNYLSWKKTYNRYNIPIVHSSFVLGLINGPYSPINMGKGNIMPRFFVKIKWDEYNRPSSFVCSLLWILITCDFPDSLKCIYNTKINTHGASVIIYRHVQSNTNCKSPEACVHSWDAKQQCSAFSILALLL